MQDAPLIPPSWASAVHDEFERQGAAFRDDLARIYASQLDREFLYGDGSPAGPIPLAPLSARLRWRIRVARVEAEKRWRGLLWRYRDVPRERLARRIAPWLMDEDEAQERFGDW